MFEHQNKGKLKMFFVVLLLNLRRMIIVKGILGKCIFCENFKSKLYLSFGEKISILKCRFMGDFFWPKDLWETNFKRNMLNKVRNDSL